MKTVTRTLADGTVKTYTYKRSPRALPGSLGAVIQEYRQSDEFLKLRPASKRAYLTAIGHMEKLYRCHVGEIKRRHIIKLRDEFRETPGIANMIVAVFSVLMNYAVEMEYRESNPAHGIKKFDLQPHRRWPDSAVEFALENLDEPFRRAVILALYTVQRESDLITTRWADYDGQGILVTPIKTGKHLETGENIGDKLWIPCHSVLKAHLESWKPDRTALTILTDANGQPFKGESFSAAISHELRRFRELDGYVFHGLRTTGISNLIEAGCTPHEAQAISGHKTLGMIEHYTKEVAQRKLATAAIFKLENAGGKRGTKTGSNA